ncbi:hypothetical protein QYE76_031904 [Lolium multiflorum]|uniref:CCHC-type domain-containing protein n=1 Tax=Lolium multiflorum TaxID=4521 RepID=A0AAD8QU16_LOLMU|nr:hypothetical protein QYE76_031904 [Lolium multiflorum]
MSSHDSSDARHRRSDRWLSSDDGGSSNRGSRSYSDVARTPPPPPPPPPRAPSPAPQPTAPQRAPASTRLGPRSEVHRIVDAAPRGADAEGWEQPRRRNHQRRHPRRDAGARQVRRSPSPEVEAGLCFRCLEPGHAVRDCINELRCRRCLLSGHGSRNCTPEQREYDRARARLPPHSAPRPCLPVRHRRHPHHHRSLPRAPW